MKELPVARVRFLSLIWQKPNVTADFGTIPVQPITFRGPREVCRGIYVKDLTTF